MSTCVSCGTELREQAKFCPRCGAKADVEPSAEDSPDEPQALPGAQEAATAPVAVAGSGRTCAHCGEELSATARFCTRCGAVAQSPAPAEAPAEDGQPEQAEAETAEVPQEPASAPEPAEVVPAGAPATISCPACGAQLSPTAAFCKQCGASVAAGAVAAAPSAEPARPLPPQPAPRSSSSRAGSSSLPPELTGFLTFRLLVGYWLAQVIFWGGTVYCVVHGIQIMDYTVTEGLAYVIGGPLVLRVLTEVAVAVLRLHEATLGADGRGGRR